MTRGRLLIAIIGALASLLAGAFLTLNVQVGGSHNSNNKTEVKDGSVHVGGNVGGNVSVKQSAK